MTEQADPRYNSRKSRFEDFLKLEKLIAQHLELPEPGRGPVTIRNEKGWRENEKFIEYVWIVEMARFPVGIGGVFAVKFSETKFREHHNKEELVQGVFRNDDGLKHFYKESLPDTSLKIADVFNINLFDANEGITIDGCHYKVGIDAMNIQTFIEVNNPVTGAWKEWEIKIWEMGRRLAKASGNIELVKLFE